MDIHARCQSCVMDLDALNVMRDEQRAPALMGFAAVRHKLEIPHDHAREPVGLGDAQAEAVLVGRGASRRSAEGLQSVAKAHALPDQCFQRLYDDGVLRIIALADTQKNIAVKKTGIAPPPSIMILIETSRVNASSGRSGILWENSASSPVSGRAGPT